MQWWNTTSLVLIGAPKLPAWHLHTGMQLHYSTAALPACCQGQGVHWPDLTVRPALLDAGPVVVAVPVEGRSPGPGGGADGLPGQTSGGQAWDDRAANGLSNGASTSGASLMLPPCSKLGAEVTALHAPNMWFPKVNLLGVICRLQAVGS